MDDITIEKYLNGELEGEDKQRFEAQLQEDTALQQTVKIYQEMRGLYNENDWKLSDSDQFATTKKHLAYLQSEKGKAMKQAVLEAETAYFSASSLGVKKLIMWAGSIAAILVIGFFVLFQSKKLGSDQLYSQYHNQWEELPSLTLRSETTQLSDIEDVFVNKEYTKALNLLQGYITAEPEKVNSQILLYLGVTQLELAKADQAILTFKQLANSDTVDAEKAQWYIALAYLKMDNKSKAKVALNLLLNDSMKFKDEEANEILEHLDN